MKDGPMTDNDLVQSALEGNMDAYRTLVDRYRGPAMALALNILANFQDAEDACQEVFLKALRGLSGFDPERSFKNWFYALLSHHCLDEIRKRKRFFRVLGRLQIQSGLAAPGHGPADRVLPAYLGLKLLGLLRPKERTAIYLWSQEGYSGAEIAAVLGCSEKTAHVHLFRARSRLRALLKEKVNDSY